MSKPKIFISSTIYDFYDLRSALKLWLDEMGFEPQLSEYNDFYKDSSIFSYDSCLKVISKCEYFVLLIGSRVGGSYPGEDISITRKEYRVAYELFKKGDIKKIFVFVRSNIWDVREDRKGLKKCLEYCEIKDRDGKEISKDLIEKHNSNIVKNAEHIFSFLDEISKKDLINKGEKPLMNWINTFDGFDDIINDLKSELLINTDLNQKLTEQLVKEAILYNMKYLSDVIDVKVIYFHNCFSGIRYLLKEYRDAFLNKQLQTLLLNENDINSLSIFVMFFRFGINELDTYVFENAISSGVFLEYSSEDGIYINTDINRALIQLISEIKKLKDSEIKINNEIQNMLLIECRSVLLHKSDNRSFDYNELTLFNSAYEKMYNIYELSKYIIEYIEYHKVNSFPELLHGFASDGIPTDEQLMSDFLANTI